MRNRRAAVTALLLLGCGKTTDSGTTGPVESPFDAGACNGSEATAEAGAPVCKQPPDGWVEQKISLGTVNRGFFRTIAGDDERIAVLGSAPDAKFAYTHLERAVYLYRRVATGWQPGGVISAPDPNEDFGVSIAVAAGFVAIGAPAADGYQGAVYVFTTGGGTPQLEQRIGYPHAVSGSASFGASVALSGSSLIVGAPGDSISGTYAGRVYAYERGGSGWTLATEIVADDVAPNDSFSGGAFDGVRLVAASGLAESRPLLHVFTRASGTWVEEARIVPPLRPAPWFEGLGGFAIGGDTLLVSTSRGRVLEYGRSEGTWKFLRHLPRTCAVDGTAAVALRGKRAAVGGAERVELFERSDGAWRLSDTLHAGDEPKQRNYGDGLVLGADSLVVFAPYDDEWGADSGAIYGYVADPTARYERECVRESTTPGNGTSCTRSGATSAVCPRLGAGSEVHGSTPSGPLDLSYAWLDVVDGFGARRTMTFGASMPRREDAVPRLAIRFPEPSVGATVAGDATLSLCDGELTVPATLTFSNVGDYFYTPLAGTLTIDAPGWNVIGSFAFDGACAAAHVSSAH